MNAFTFPTVETALPDARPLLEGPPRQLGFLPNLLAGLSNSPETLASYLDLAKHFSKVGLTGIEMQTVLVVASVENACAYCVAAHSTFATSMKIDPAVLTALRHGGEPPMRSSPRWRHLCALSSAGKVMSPQPRSINSPQPAIRVSRGLAS